MTVAWQIKSPFRKVLCVRNGTTEYYRSDLVTIWHVDPCRGPGGDDSCGWFKRAHHGDPKVLERIEKAFEFDWDRTFTPDGTDKVYFCGLFKPDGHPNHSVLAIVINLFFLATGAYFDSRGGRNWSRSRKWMRDNLFDVIHFAENPVDSLFDGITRKFEDGCHEAQTPRLRKERIHNMAATIYGYILRSEQKWWQHPRWHIHHWKIQIHFMESLKRWLFTRCCKCGKRFKFGASACSTSWHGTGPRWFRSETNIYHDGCGE